MSGSNRMPRLALLALCLAGASSLASARLSFAALPLQADAKAAFEQAVDLLARGRNDEALVGFQTVLNAGLTEDQAYEIFRMTESDTWLDMLRQGGEMELTARRLMSLATSGRRAHRDNAEAIKTQIAKLDSADTVERRSAIRTLSGEHGAFAVPYMLPALADQGNDDRRVAMITALASMDTSVVVPLLAVLDSDDAFLRRNVAFALGHIRDPRASGTLAARASSDPDPSVREAAQQALDSIGQGAKGDTAVSMLLQEGTDYSLRSGRILADYQYSDVVWSYEGGALVATPTPRDIYPDEMARQCFYRALALDPTNLRARAGIARAAASVHARAQAMAQVGGDVTALEPVLQSRLVAANATGAAAQDLALAECLEQGDMGTAAVLARMLHGSGTAQSLATALGANDASVRGEAAISLANRRGGAQTVDPRVLAELGEAAGREVLRIALIVDADAARAGQWSAALEAKGWLTAVAPSGGRGLSMMQRLAGMDAVLVAESLPDMTTQQVIAEMRLDSRLEKTPALLLTASAEKAAEIFGESVQGTLTSAADLTAVETAVAGALDGDRAQADELAARAAKALAHLGSQGVDISATRGALHRALTRPDAVSGAACMALASAGDSESVAALAGACADEARSLGVREAAAHAIAEILGRQGGELSADGAKALSALLQSSSEPALAAAAARALGAANLSAADRASLLEGMRAKVGTP